MITASLNDYQLPLIERDFIDTPIIGATDVQTLDLNIYTDFVDQKKQWTFNYSLLTKAEYDSIRSIFDSQFTDFDYPLLSIPFYSLIDQPVRMYINEKNIWNNCGDVQNVQIIFRETDQLDFGSS